jgi:hypothetical protein
MPKKLLVCIHTRKQEDDTFFPFKLTIQTQENNDIISYDLINMEGCNY